MFKRLITVLIATASIGSSLHAMTISLSTQQCLIQNIIAKSKGTWTETHAAAYYGFDNVLLEALNSTNPSVSDNDGVTPLHMAIERGNLSAAHTLIQHGAQVDACTRQTRLTPLHLAVESGNKAAVELLLAAQAPIDAISASGTPLVIACEQESLNLDIIHLLLAHETDPNLRNPINGHAALDRLVLTLVPNYQGTDWLPSDVRNVDFSKNDPVDRPSDIAQRIQRPKIAKLVIQLLLAHGARFNEYVTAPKSEEITVWHSLAQYPNNEILKLLLDHSTEHLDVLFDGETALDIAEANAETFELLRSYGAHTSAELLVRDENLEQLSS